MTCKSTSAGAVQLESHEVEAWSVIQQEVSFSSNESKSYATEASRLDGAAGSSPEGKSQDWRVSRDSWRRRG